MIVHSPKDLALYVNDRRKQIKLSQVEAGRKVGLKQATFSSFENKPEGTKLETLFRILSATNLELTISPRDEPASGAEQWDQEW